MATALAPATCPASGTAPATAAPVAGLSPTALATLHYLRLAGPSEPRHVAAALEVPPLDVAAALTVLADRGLVCRAGGASSCARKSHLASD